MKALALMAILAGMASMDTSEAAELKVIAGGSLTALLKELGPQFEKASGHTLSIHFDSTPNIIARMTSGRPFDLILVPQDVFRDTGARALLAPSPTVEIAEVGYGIIVRSGAARPDISTSDALKKTLLSARSVAFVPPSAAGAYITKVFERLGIGEEMKAKTKALAMPAQIAPAVAGGDAELGVFLTNVLRASGVDLIGPLPEPLQQNLTFVAGIAASTREANAAIAFIDFLREPPAISAIEAAGMKPSLQH